MRRFNKEKGFFNGQTMTAFLWRNKKGSFTSLVEPETTKGNCSYAHSFDLKNGVNIYIDHKTKANFLLAKVVITGDNSKNGKFSTFIGKVTKEIPFDSIDNSYSYMGTRDNEFLKNGQRVGLFMTRGCKLADAIAACKDGYSNMDESISGNLKKLINRESAPDLFKKLAVKKLNSM